MKRFQKYIQDIFQVSIPEKQIMKELYTEITSSLNNAYHQQSVQKYLRSLSAPSLLSKSVELFVGSKTTPRNDSIMNMLLSLAKEKAVAEGNVAHMKLVAYYYAYYVKMGALKDGNEDEHERSTEMFMKLAEDGDPLSCYLIGKESYKVIESEEIANIDPQIIDDCRQMFANSICDKQYGGMFYEASIEQKLPAKWEQKQAMIREMYVQSASLGYPLAYFKLARIYRAEGNIMLYKKYLLLAAEAGVVEAQHNLGFEYQKGEYFVKDEVKAVAWFLQASAQGFIYSKYNLAKILMQGSFCGRIKPNKNAALVYLEELNRGGQINVTEQIQSIVRSIGK